MGRVLKTLGHRQSYAAGYVFPKEFGRQLSSRHPEVEDLGSAIKGLRQWLRIDVTAPGQLSIPSMAVAELWREFVRSDDYHEYHDHAYGRHRKDSETADDDEGLALAFALAAADEGEEHHELGKPPWLFRVDEECGIEGGQKWVLTCGKQECHARSGARCIYHELGDLVPTGKGLPAVFEPGWKPPPPYVPVLSPNSVQGAVMDTGSHMSGLPMLGGM